MAARINFIDNLNSTIDIQILFLHIFASFSLIYFSSIILIGALLSCKSIKVPLSFFLVIQIHTSKQINKVLICCLSIKVFKLWVISYKDIWVAKDFTGDFMLGGEWVSI